MDGKQETNKVTFPFNYSSHLSCISNHSHQSDTLDTFTTNREERNMSRNKGTSCSKNKKLILRLCLTEWKEQRVESIDQKISFQSTSTETKS